MLSVLACLLAALVWLKGSLPHIGGPYVARVSVGGLITDNAKLTNAIDALADDGEVKAVVLKIDSPGGSVAGGEALHDAIARVAAKKPVVAVMGGMAASAGYMIAVAAQRIYAHESTLTGSIGVLLEAPEFSGLLAKLGVDAQVIRSGPLKDEPSLVRPLSPAGRDVAQGLVNDLYDQFVTMVASGRKMPVDKVRQLGDGRPYTGRQALALGLVDAIGGERDARAWLAAEKNVPMNVRTEDVSVEGYASRALSGQAAALLVDIWKTVFSQSVSLDGAWAVWHRSGL
ncbi:MAG TPA: signal peptide peptidase SppA [Rhodopila sp.]|uniref:signal peptide peptidase SppA n=1 Tax=Rhodopila sp. TaxID=2480087 RepID=UPI002B5126BA|nr:signal peptide peptidase SppA [Rhodopila sp.]HVY16905.1 signal peptide peptidase SppA [Rhodopila sp.]